jgi:hypothetical protein
LGYSISVYALFVKLSCKILEKNIVENGVNIQGPESTYRAKDLVCSPEKQED